MFFMTKYRKQVIGLVITLVFVITITVSPQEFPINLLEDYQYYEPSTPIVATWDIKQPPILGETTTLNCIVTSVLDAPETSIQLELPEGVQVLQGEVSWIGDLHADVPVTLSVWAVFREAGNAALFCKALSPIDENSTWGDLAEYYVNIGAEFSSPGFAPIPPENRLGHGQLLEEGDGEIIEQEDNLSLYSPSESQNLETIPSLEPSLDGIDSNVISPETPAGQLTVTGRWSYYDRDDVYTGGRDMLVELKHGITSDNLAWCWTDVDGYYSCGPVTNPGSDGVRTIMYAYTNYNPNPDLLAVVNPDWGTTPDVYNTFGMQTNSQILADGTQDIGSWYLPNDNTFERAFWIQRDLVDAWRYVWIGAGSSQSPQETAGPTTVEWKIDSTDGTYYSRGGNIHLKGADPLSNTVVNHEYGHNIMYTIYGDWMPTTYCPSPHYINRSSHENCAWTEGWSNFITIAVNNDPVYRWSSGSSLNLETPTWGTPDWHSGEDVEGRVAGAMWDILDTVNDGYDTYSDSGIANLWDTIYHQNDNKFREYWSAWKSRGHNQPGAGMSIYQNTINYLHVLFLPLVWR